MPAARELLRFLSRKGCRKVRQTGSHLILEHTDGRALVIPMHSGDLPTGLFRRILIDGGFTIGELTCGTAGLHTDLDVEIQLSQLEPRQGAPVSLHDF